MQPLPQLHTPQQCRSSGVGAVPAATPTSHRPKLAGGAVPAAKTKKTTKTARRMTDDEDGGKDAYEDGGKDAVPAAKTTAVRMTGDYEGEDAVPSAKTDGDGGKHADDNGGEDADDDDGSHHGSGSSWSSLLDEGDAIRAHRERGLSEELRSLFDAFDLKTGGR